MKSRFLPAASSDLYDAVDYYENQRPGLGAVFTSEVFGTIERIKEYPEGWTQVSDKLRRCIVNRFSYELIYVVESDCILVVSVANQHRHSDFLKNRRI